MKIYLGAAMISALFLTACAQPKPAAPAAADNAAADQTQLVANAAPAKKKKCSDQTGSRLAPCGEGATGDSVQGSSGDAYRDASMHSAPIKSPN